MFLYLPMLPSIPLLLIVGIFLVLVPGRFIVVLIGACTFGSVIELLATAAHRGRVTGRKSRPVNQPADGSPLGRRAPRFAPDTPGTDAGISDQAFAQAASERLALAGRVEDLEQVVRATYRLIPGWTV